MHTNPRIRLHVDTDKIINHKLLHPHPQCVSFHTEGIKKMVEKTHIIVKPDGVQRGLVGKIISRFEAKGYRLAAMKTKQATAEIIESHYRQHLERPFYPMLQAYMLSGPVVCMVWEGPGAVEAGGKMLGATNPLSAEPGTIRGDFGVDVGRNICHSADSIESASREIELWFEEGEVLDWESHSKNWIFE